MAGYSILFNGRRAVFLLDSSAGYDAMKHKSPEASMAFIAQQRQQAKKGSVECECERVIPLRFVYRCLYCGIWLCQECAEIHFGKTREQYLNERSQTP